MNWKNVKSDINIILILLKIRATICQICLCNAVSEILYKVLNFEHPVGYKVGTTPCKKVQQSQ